MKAQFQTDADADADAGEGAAASAGTPDMYLDFGRGNQSDPAQSSLVELAKTKL